LKKKKGIGGETKKRVMKSLPRTTRGPQNIGGGFFGFLVGGVVFLPGFTKERVTRRNSQRGKRRTGKRC